MPRPGPRRPLVCVRMSEDDIALIDAYAEREGVNRSEMIRRLVIQALENGRSAR